MEQATQYQIGRLTTAPLGVLIPSKEGNVRKKKRTPESVLSMAISIHAHGGVLQNLVVVPEVRDGRQTGKLEVSAGETRRLGLCALRDGKVKGADGYTNDYPVPVLIKAPEESTALSTTENVQRVNMHPADEFAAFKKLVDQCGSIEEVAAVYNVTPPMVQRRLKLANASPRLLELYREDGMTLDQLMALCLTDDHAAQERVWDAAAGREWERTPECLRRALTSQEIDVRSALVRFVGLRDYESAGGRVRRDLFSDDDSGYVIDTDLLQQMALARLDKRAAKVKAEGWNWVQTRTSLQYHELSAFGRVHKVQRALSGDEQCQLDELRAAIDADEETLDRLDAAVDDGEAADEQVIDSLRRKLKEQHGRLQKLLDSYATWTAEGLSAAGAIVALDHAGNLVVHRGLVKPEDRKAAVRAMSAGAASADEERASDGGKPKAALSEALMRRLTAHRTIALQRTLADNTQVALAALTHNLVQRVFQDGFFVHSAVCIRADTCAQELSRCGDVVIEDSRPWQELKQLKDQWGERIPGGSTALLPWLISLPLAELCDLLALCVALTVNALTSDHRNHPADDLASAVGLDMADWWEPSAMSYLNHVPKARILEAVTEAVSAESAAALSKLKKGELVAQAETLMAGRRWLPAVLRPRSGQETAESVCA